MKKLLIVFALIIAYLLYSCGNKNKVPLLGYLTPKNLSSQLFTIDITKDTALTTAEGIKIKIPANAIQSKSSSVTLEVKEALSIGEMLKAGLTTRSDKGILRSDGMFYINTKEEASIVKPISIDVPTNYADSSMQLYKGKEDEGRVMWEKPEALQTQSSPYIDEGRKLFRTNCASCHGIEKRLTGPALGWVTKRRSMDWLRQYTRSVSNMLEKGDPYACCLFKEYNGVAMMPFPNLTDHDIDNMYKYIDRESRRLGLSEDIGASACDSCTMSAAVLHNLQYKVENLRNEKDSLINDNGNMTVLEYKRDENGAGSEGGGIRNENNGNIPKINPPTYKAEYYQFKITVFGWYNIDDLLSRGDFSETELKVKLNSPQTMRINMYLVVPSQKIFTEGGFLSDEKYWGFYELDGKIKLPHGAQAYVVAVGEESGNTYFGSTPFIISAKQTIEVNVFVRKKELIVKDMETMQLKNVLFEVNKSKHHGELKKVQASIDSLNAILQKCSCFWPSDTLSFK